LRYIAADGLTCVVGQDVIAARADRGFPPTVNGDVERGMAVVAKLLVDPLLPIVDGIHIPGAPEARLAARLDWPVYGTGGKKTCP
jgi:hypothetical protein